jgi:membrane-associated phospholipid phosphatase
MTLIDDHTVQRRRPGRSWATRVLLLGVATLASAGVWLTYRSLVATSLGQRFDQRAMVESMQAAPADVSRLQHLLSVVSVPSVAIALGVFAIVAVRRSRPDLAVVAAVTIIGANVTTQALKATLDRPDLGLGGTNSFPSGHVTVIASVAAAAFLVSSRRVRPVVASAGLLVSGAAAVGAVALGWHRPSDIVGAGLVVAGWAAAVSAVIPSRRTSTGNRSRRTVVV